MATSTTSTPFTQPGSAVPYVPTGYEALQRSVDLKRKLAESMLAAPQQENMRSPFQALAQVLEAYGGKTLERRAEEDQAALDQQRTTDYTAKAQALTDALSAPNADRTAIVQRASLDPALANSPLVKSLMDADAERQKNLNTFDAPVNVMGSDGKLHLRAYNKAGGFQDDAGGATLPEKINVAPGGQEYGESTGKVMGILPDVSKESYLGPDGKPVLNTALIGAKKDIAAAGKTQVTMSPYINAMDKSFGKVIPEATISDLTKSRDTALAYQQTAPNLDRAANALHNGIISGFGAGARLDLARAADALGVGGRSNSEKIANTQVYIQNMGKQLLPILAALRPASDSDVKTAQMMSGGDPSLSPRAMLSAINAARSEGGAALRRHSDRVKSLQAQYSNQPDIAQGIGTFAIPDEAPASSGKITVRRIK